MRTDPAELTALELVAAYRTGELSPTEAADAALKRIDDLDDQVGGYCLVDQETTRDQAAASAARWQRGQPAGLLDGVPVAVKDVFLTAGWPTLRGSASADPTGPWEADAPAVAALRRHGAVLSGKTTTPELGWKAVTDSPLHGISRNPWDSGRTSGGSSGGSASAVALGMSPLALGTDGGGSIRIPCGFCGLVGIKPTHGRVPLWPISPYGTLSHAGPISRTVADTALLLDVLSEPDPRDTTAPPPTRQTADGLDAGIGGLRIAYSRDLGYADVDADVAAAVDSAVKVLEGLGAHVEELDPGFPDPLEDFNTLWYAAVANATASSDPAQLDPGLAEIREQGRQIGLMDYLDATRRRAELGITTGEFHARYDVLVTPTLPIGAFTAGREVPDGWPHRRWPTWTPFSLPFNMTGQPAATVPCGLTGEGLPVGLQFVGARHADALVLQAAYAYEQAAPFEHRPLTQGVLR